MLRTLKRFGAASGVAALTFGVMTSAAVAQADATHRVESPDGRTTFTVNDHEDGSLTYTVTQDGDPVIDESQLGVVTRSVDLSTNLQFESESTEKVSQTYELDEHFNGDINSQANQLTLDYSQGEAQFTVIIQVHNDGVAFKYDVEGVGETEVIGETTTYSIPEGTGLWASEYREARDYEEQFLYQGIDDIKDTNYAMPLLGSLRDNSAWMLISEAAVYVDPTYPATRVDSHSDLELTTELPGPDDDVFNTDEDAVAFDVSDTFETPWRTIVASDSLEDVVNTSLITDLNPEVDATIDTSWVKPGKTLWSWWSNEEKDEHGDDMVRSQKEYIDMAEHLNMQYVTVDCCYDDDNDDIETLAQHGQDKGIEIFIWKNKDDYLHSDGSNFSAEELDQEMVQVAERGVAGLKIDFMMSDRLETIQLYEQIAKAALDNDILINFHGNTKPGGENRTYPNLITSEAILGSEQYKYGRAPSAKDNATFPFTRNVIGGMDYTPVIFSNRDLNTTQGHQLALGIVFNSAMVHFADSAAAYETWIGRHILAAMPTVWDESVLVEGFPDSYATFARRTGEDWFVAGITDGARTSEVVLDFLDDSTTYTATIFKDGDADEEIVEDVQEVTSTDTLEVPLREHGGFAIHIGEDPLEHNELVGDLYEAEDPANATSGNAEIGDCPGCSGGEKVGDLYKGSSLTFNDVVADEAGEYTLRVGYLSQDARDFTISINDADPELVSPPRSGGGEDGSPSGWDIVRNVEVPVDLVQGANTVTIADDDGYAPDIDRIIVVKGTSNDDLGDDSNSPEDDSNGSENDVSSSPGAESATPVKKTPTYAG